MFSLKRNGVEVTMYTIQLTVYFVPFYITYVFGFLDQNEIAEPPKFHILAPRFVCPRDNDSAIVQSDNIFVTLQTDPAANLSFMWKVRCEWNLIDSPSQRNTVALWKIIRRLEKRLNEPPAEPGVYLINHTQLLKGVNYIFNVTATSPDSNKIMEKSFQIDIIKDNKIFLPDEKNNLFFISLIGSATVYKNMEYIAEAIVNTCGKIPNYYFRWTVTSAKYNLDVTETRGSRLEIKANSLIPGLKYRVLCQALKYSTVEVIAEDSLEFYVQHRDLNVYFNIDMLVVSVNTPFKIQASLENIDYSNSELNITWACFFNDETYINYVHDYEGWFTFPFGLPEIGEYIVSITVQVYNLPGATSASARIITVENKLPVIEVALVSRLPTENTDVTLNAFVYKVASGCTISWYFTYEECMYPFNSSNIHRCSKNPRGYPISTPENFYSIEESYLHEMSDFSNLTFERSVEATMKAASGTARVIADCECNLEKNGPCSNGSVYAEVELKVNETPSPSGIVLMVQPEIGTAMMTIYRLSTRAILDSNRPLQYTFYCDLGNNDSLVLGTYLEYLSIETMLPYVEGGTSVWVEVCDSLEACSVSLPIILQQYPGDARTLNMLISEAEAYVMRCETGWLLRLATSAIITYANAGQQSAYTKFTRTLKATLRDFGAWCIKLHSEQYSNFIEWLEDMAAVTLLMEGIVEDRILWRKLEEACPAVD